MVMKESNNRQFYTALEKITLAIVAESDIHRILETFLNEIAALIPYSCANIMLETGGTLRTLSWKGYEQYGADTFISTFSVGIADSGKAPRILERKKIEIIPNTHADPEWKVFPETAFIRSSLIAPLIHNDTVIGALFLDSDKTDTFGRDDAALLEPLMSIAAAVIVKSRKLKEARDEIRKRKAAEKELQRSLSIQGVLVREINHRVRNNLSIIMALIHMQGDKLFERYHENLLMELERRVFSIALIHEKLVESSDPSKIDVESYLLQIVDFVRSSGIYREDIHFSTTLSGTPFFNMDTLLPLGLIVMETISNSLEHAFPASGGEITLTGYTEGTVMHIRLADTGVGFPPGISTTSGGGLQLIQSLTDQIQGTVALSNEGGAVTDLSFPAQSPA